MKMSLWFSLMLVAGLAINVRAAISASQTSRVTGQVVDAEDKPAAGLRVFVFPNYGSPDSRGGVLTDSNGRYEISWNPRMIGGSDRTFCLVVRDSKRNLAVARDLDEENTTLDLRLEPGLVLSGRVEDEDGKPLPDATVSIILWAGNMGMTLGDQTVNSDAQGRFEMKALPPDRRYSASVTAKGYGSASSRRIEEGTSETNRLELEPFVLRVANLKLAGQVVDPDDKPVGNAFVHMYGSGQPNDSVRTDSQGRFKFDAVCEGMVRLSASGQSSSGNTTAEAGETNVVIHLGSNMAIVSEGPRRVSLRGRPLPDLAPFGISAEVAPAGKPLLVCLLDAEQRPSRRTVRLLADQYDALRQKGVSVLAIQASAASPESFQSWTNSSPLPFPVGRIAEKSATTKWATEVESLPWVILRDAEGKVAAEGFALDELDIRLGALKR